MLAEESSPHDLDIEPQTRTPVVGDAPKTCCTPSSGRVSTPPVTVVPSAITVATEGEMISLPGGCFLMGTDYAGGFPLDGEGPIRSVVLSPFAIDATPVTNREFAEFVEATHYVTEAERFGWSFVFWGLVPEERFSELVQDTALQTPWWCKVNGASWKAPEGPGSSWTGRDDYPVVHVSQNDAQAYAVWIGKELPTEAEWEYAARGGLMQKLYPWGDELTPGGVHQCNIWQGEFPLNDTAEDGFAGLCPVRAFPPNNFGLYSVAGNVWEWTADWFATEHPKSETTDPRGPDSGTGKVMKGGSFLCHASYCNRYRIAARTQNTPDSSASNIGFRCVRRLSTESA